MKTLNIFALAAAAAITLSACSSKDDFALNTAEGVTVSFGETQVEVLENRGLFTIPMDVTGDPNGYVRVTIECIEITESPAIKNVHYFVTDESININPEDKVGYVEINTHDRRGLDPDRAFIVKIASVEGAALGSPSECHVDMIDKGSSPLFNQLAGNYYISGDEIDFDTEEMIPYMEQMSLRVLSEQDMTLTGNCPQGAQMEFVYNYDEEEKWGEMEFVYGFQGATSGPYVGLWRSPEGAIDGTLAGKWNAAYTAASFGNTDTQLELAAYQNGTYMGAFFIISGFTLSKVLY